MCSWKSPAHRRKDESSSRAPPSPSSALWGTSLAAQVQFASMSCLLHPTQDFHGKKQQKVTQTGAMMLFAPILIPWGPRLSTVQSLRGAGSWFWDHGNSQASPGSRTGWTNHRHSAELMFKLRQTAGLFPWSPLVTFTLDPPQQPRPPCFQLHFPSGGSTRLELTFQSSTWKQETK